MIHDTLSDDQLLQEFQQHANSLFAPTSAEQRRHAVVALREFLHTDLLGHFRYEEQKIFPALRVIHSTGVAKLEAEHKILREEADSLDELLSRHMENPVSGGAMRECVDRFGAILKQHAALENRLFPSLP